MTREFAPALWAGNPHVQTVCARLLRGRAGVSFVRERISTPDRDFIDLDYPLVHSYPALDSWPLAIVLHGLEGSARSKYAIEAYRCLARRGVAAVGFNFRSCSGELNVGKRLYHSGETSDLGLVLEHLAAKFPDRALGAIGFSIGGNVLLKYLGERGASALKRLIAVATISVPFDLAAGAEHIEKGFSKVYRFKLIRSLKAKVRAKADHIADLIEYSRTLRSSTFWEFDDAATAPLHGFSGADDYYAQSSSNCFIERIAVPTCLIQSRDDPFVPADAIPESAARDNPAIETNFLDRGGHVGFVGGPPWEPVFWAERRAAEFVSDQLCGFRCAVRSVG